MTSTENARSREPREPREPRERGVMEISAVEPSASGLYAPLEPGPPSRAIAAARGVWAYRKAALLHPSNLIALAAVLMLGLINPSAQLVLLGLGAEILFLCVAPRSHRLCRSLDDGYVEAAEAARGRAREALVAKMSEGHRDELKRLEGLVKKIQEDDGPRAPRGPLDPVDLHRLTGSYIRLALAYKACEEALALTEQRSLRASMRALLAAEPSCSERVRAAIRERLAIAEERVADEARVREDLEVISHQLAMIADLIYLQHQRAITVGPSAEVDRFIQDLDAARSAAREIAALDVIPRPTLEAEPRPTLQEPVACA